MSDQRKEILEFWNARAEKEGTAGTDDFILTELEVEYLLDCVPRGSRVLDVGCGNAGALKALVENKACTGVGIDYAEKLVALANRAIVEDGLQNRLRIEQGQMPNIDLGYDQFDVVITKRSLINLADANQQYEAFKNLASYLKPGGKFLMIESTKDGLLETNRLRKNLSLPAIEVPWHNCFLSVNEVKSWVVPGMTLLDIVEISSTYYFLSRVVYAGVADENGESLRYDSQINLMSRKLPQNISGCGPVKAFVWTRAVEAEE